MYTQGGVFISKAYSPGEEILLESYLKWEKTPPFVSCKGVERAKGD